MATQFSASRLAATPAVSQVAASSGSASSKAIPPPRLLHKSARSLARPRQIVTQESTLTSGKYQELLVFLSGAGLLHLADLLVRNGFDDMETLVEIAETDLIDMAVAPHDATRLIRALQEQGLRAGGLDEAHPVVVFLREAGLRQHAETLLRHGFDDMETLLEAENGDLQGLGLPRGHALRLAKRLRERRGTGLPTAGCSSRQAACTTPPALPPSEPTLTAVQRSWERVRLLGSSTIGERLYKHVFRLRPDVVALFPLEVRFKYREWTQDEGDESDVNNSPGLGKLFGRVVNAIGLSVAGLHRPAELVPTLTQLGGRHVGYGVRVEHWKLLGDALNCTLRECLGDEFTPEVELAWTLVYGFVSAIMIEGLRAASNTMAPSTPCTSDSSDASRAAEALPSAAAEASHDAARGTAAALTAQNSAIASSPHPHNTTPTGAVLRAC